MTAPAAPALGPGSTGSPSRWARVRPPVLVAGAVLGASVLLHLRDPHQAGSYGFCPWLAMTGTYCPGCGGLRAVNDLTRGDLADAASSNLLFVGALPLVVFLWGRWLSDSWRGVARRVDTRHSLLAAAAVLLLALVFMVLRNLPAFDWLAP